MKITSESEFQAAELRLEQIVHAKPDTREAEELKILVPALIDYLRSLGGAQEAA